MRALVVPFAVLVLALAAPARAQDAGPDAGPLDDAGPDGGLDAGLADGGLDAGLDDGGIDAGLVDGGLDAGPFECVGFDESTCTGDVLSFCDESTGEVRSLDCSELGARCGLLSETWGFDCLLPAGATCDPRYAGGLSRCDGAAEGLVCCTGGSCTARDLPDAGADAGADADAGEPESCPLFVPQTPRASGPSDVVPIGGSRGTDTNPSCPLDSCTGTQQVPFASLALGLWALRRRRRRKAS